MDVPFINGITTRPFRAALHTLVREWRVMRAHRRGVRKVGCDSSLRASYRVWTQQKTGLDQYRSQPRRRYLSGSPGAAALSRQLSEDGVQRTLLRASRPRRGYTFPSGVSARAAPRRAIKPWSSERSTVYADYVSGDREKWMRVRDRYHPKWCTTPMHSANYFFRQDGEHKYAYDEETLY
jgi:hypothetical protein